MNNIIGLLLAPGRQSSVVAHLQKSEAKLLKIFVYFVNNLLLKLACCLQLLLNFGRNLLVIFLILPANAVYADTVQLNFMGIGRCRFIFSYNFSYADKKQINSLVWLKCKRRGSNHQQLCIFDLLSAAADRPMNQLRSCKYQLLQDTSMYHIVFDFLLNSYNTTMWHQFAHLKKKNQITNSNSGLGGLLEFKIGGGECRAKLTQGQG